MRQVFDEVVVDRAVRVASEAIVKRWPVWLGVVFDDGDTLPLAGIKQREPNGLCSHFMVNPVKQEGEGSRFLGCNASQRKWAQSTSGDVKLTTRLTSCHAGFSALLIPLFVEVDGVRRCVAQVYASGFVVQSELVTSYGQLRKSLVATGIEDEDVQSRIDGLSHLDRDQLKQMTAHAELLTKIIEDQLQEKHASTTHQQMVSTEGSFCGMIGKSRAMVQMFDLIERVARTNSTILILGENGTGKELVAQALHRLSYRRDQPYMVQNCAAIPAELIESELFGHKKGAFSGAHRDRKGLFESADQGSFFLDEIGEMDIVLQAKMLRVVQEGSFLPVGDSSYRKVDVRLVLATNRDLKQMVRDKKFREDLFFRINVITIDVPPLRERRVDIPVLAQHFMLKAARRHGLAPKQFSQEALELMSAYEWPGNVRELENEVERMMILSGDQQELGVSALSPSISGVEVTPQFQELTDMELPEAVELLERQMILESLKRNDFNKTHTAKELGVSRRNLIRKVAKYGFETGEDD